MRQLHVKINDTDFKKFKSICNEIDKSMSDVVREYIEYINDTYKT